MKADDVNRELESWNRNRLAAWGSSLLFEEAQAGMPIACLPLQEAIYFFSRWRCPIPYTDAPTGSGAPADLLPRLRPWGELEDDALFMSADTYGRDYGRYLPTLTADDYLEELAELNALLAGKHIGFLHGSGLEGEITRFLHTGTRHIALPDTSDLSDPQAVHDTRAAAILAGLAGEFSVQRTGSVLRSLGVTVQYAGYMEAKARIGTQYEGDSRLSLYIYTETERATVKSWLRVPVTLTVIWQDLPYSLYTPNDTSGSGVQEPDLLDPDIVPYWTAPLTMQSSCRTLWDPEAQAGFIGTAPYSDSWGDRPRLIWREPEEEPIPFSAGVQDLRVEWKTFDLEPGQTIELFPPQFTLPDRLEVEHLTAFHDLTHRRLFWLAYRPKMEEI